MAFEHDCDTIERLIAERSERTLRPDEAVGVARAVASCESCKRFYAMHDEVVDLLPETRVDGASLLSDGFTDRLMAKLAAQRAETVPNRDADEPAESRDNMSGARRIARVPDDAPPTRTTIELPVTPSVRKDGPGTIRHMPRWRAVAAVAAVLLATLFGIRLLSESGSIGATTRCGNVMVRRASASTPAWEVLPDSPTLRTGDAVYVAADSVAELRLADDVTVQLADDCLATLRANAIEVACGTAIVRAADGRDASVATPFGRVTARGGETVVRVDRPFASTANGAAGGELVAWVRSGSAAWSREGSAAAATLNAGDARVVGSRGAATALSASEAALLAEDVERIGANPPAWSPNPVAALEGSLALALTDRTYPEAVTAAVSIAGRLGYADIVASAPDALAEPNTTYSAALASALVRTDTATRESRLTRLLVDGDESVRVVAAQALGAIGSPTAIDTLAHTARDERNDAGARLAATLAVAALDRPAPADAATLARQAEHAAAMRAIGKPRPGLTGDRDALAALATDASRSALDRLEAVAALEALCDPTTEPTLIRATTDPDPRVRDAATAALGNRRVFESELPGAARDALVARVHDRSVDEHSRRIAMNALAKRAFSNAELLPIIQDRSLPISVRAIAARALDKATIDGSQVDYLLASIEAERPATNVTPIITGLFSPATPRTTLLDRLEDRDPAVVEAAAKFLSRSLRNKTPWTTTEVERLSGVRLLASSRLARDYLRSTISRVAPKRALDLLLEEWPALEGLDERASVLVRLRRYEGDRTNRFFRTVLSSDADDLLRSSAALSLAMRGAPGRGVVGEISAIYSRLVQHDRVMALAATMFAARALLLIEPTLVVEDLRSVVLSGGPSAANAGRHLASALPAPELTRLLVDARHSRDPSVRYHVARLFQDFGFDPASAATIRDWFHTELDPWTRVLLANSLSMIDGEPLATVLREFAASNANHAQRKLAARCQIELFAELVGAAESRTLTRQQRARLTAALNTMAVPGRTSLRTHGVSENQSAWRHYSDVRSTRIRLLRAGLRSTCGRARAAAANASNGTPDASLLPILIRLLDDEASPVRAAALGAVDRVAPGLTDGYDISATGPARRAMVDRVRDRLSGSPSYVSPETRAVSLLDARK